MEPLEKSSSDVVVIKDIVESLLKQTLAKEIQYHLRNQLAEQQALQASRKIQEKPESLNNIYDHQLFERMVRVEEELKQNQVILKAFMQQMDKRFETVQQSFETMQQNIDKRLDIMQQNMDKRFEQVDKRFETMQQNIDKRLDIMQQNMDKRFEQVDKRFETMQQNMDKRLEQVDKRFEQVDKRFETMQQSMDKRFETMQQNIDKRFLMLQWFMGIGFGLIIGILGLLKLS